MPRPGWRKPVSDRRLSDLASVGLLMKVFPPGMVDEVIARYGRTEQRRRALPARSVAYFTMGMALHPRGSYSDVLALVSDGMAWAEQADVTSRLANKAAISQARDRLGPEPMKGLFERVAVPLTDPDTPGSWLAGRRLVMIDQACLDLPDTPANEAQFGRPAHLPGRRSVAVPQARVVALAECGTNAVFDAVIGPCTAAEPVLAEDLLARLAPGMLCLDNRECYSHTAWQTGSGTGADLLCRVGDDPHLDRVRELSDGSYLAQVPDSHADPRRRRPTTVRVVEHVAAADGRPETRHRLISTLLDPREAPATALVAAFRQPWKLVSAFDELAARPAARGPVLRSRSPDLVVQEIWGHLCCHYAIRTLLAPTSLGASDPA